MARLGSALLALGCLILVYAGLWEFGLAPGSRVVLPAPVALERAGSDVREVTAPRPPVPDASSTSTSTSAVLPAMPPMTLPPATALALPTLAPATTLEMLTPQAAAAPLAAADREDRAAAAPRETGYAVRLAIPAIKLDTVVEQAGIVQDTSGNQVWQTLPFVAVHYGDLTSLIGAPGNAVIAGHVATLNEGNVFRFLYQLDLGDRVQVWDDRAAEHAFSVVDIRLVPPSDISVMAPTPGETLTLITCGGTFDPRKRQFSDRLVVTARPL